MARRPLVLSIAVAGGVGLATVGYHLHQAQTAASLVEEAIARLEAPLNEAPELDRLQASTAASLLERAEGLRGSDREISAALHHARALEHLTRGDLIFAEGELMAARQEMGFTADLHVLAAAIAYRRADHDAARAHLDEALALEPEHPRARLLLADLLLDVGSFGQAADLLGGLAASDGDVGAVHNRRGLALDGLGDEAGAEAAFRRAAELEPRAHDPWINLGRLLRRRGDHPGALAAFDAALERQVAEPDALLGRGLCHQALGDASSAEQDFLRAAELLPHDAEPLLALGDLARDVGKMAEAVTIYRAAIARDDADAASWLKLGNALVMTRDLDDAARAFEQALVRAPTLAAAYNGLGAARMQLGDDEAAIAALTRAAELDRADPNPRLNLGLLHQRRGDRRAANEAFDSALVLAGNR